MGKGISKFLKLVVLAGTLPFVYGCGSGGGVSSLASFLFGSTGIGGGIALLTGAVAETALASVGSEQLATLHQPEPTSMLLVGGGLAAMAYFKSRKK